jgi:hypothetical protein
LFLLYVKKVAGATDGKKIFARGESELVNPAPGSSLRSKRVRMPETMGALLQVDINQILKFAAQ